MCGFLILPVHHSDDVPRQRIDRVFGLPLGSGERGDEMTILFIQITDNFPYKTDRLLKLEIRSEIL